MRHVVECPEADQIRPKTDAPRQTPDADGSSLVSALSLRYAIQPRPRGRANFERSSAKRSEQNGSETPIFFVRRHELFIRPRVQQDIRDRRRLRNCARNKRKPTNLKSAERAKSLTNSNIALHCAPVYQTPLVFRRKCERAERAVLTRIARSVFWHILTNSVDIEIRRYAKSPKHNILWQSNPTTHKW